MKVMKLLLCAVTITAVPASHAVAQVQTNIPEVVPGANPVIVEHIKRHGAALEGNLEGDAVDPGGDGPPPAQLPETAESPIPRSIRATRPLDCGRAVDA